MLPGAQLLQFLGVPIPSDYARSPLGFVALVERGFNPSVLKRLCDAIAPGDAKFRYRVVPKPTLARRTRRLSQYESERVARLAEIWQLSLETWKNEEEARTFLFRP